MTGLTTTILLIVGVALIAFGLYALFKLREKDASTTVEILGMKFTSQSPAVILIFLGILCISGKFAPASAESAKIPADVQVAYLDLIDAYNSNDAPRYYGHFTSPVECFYSLPNISIADKRPDLTSHLQVVAEDLAPLDVQPARVEFCDRGWWVDKSTIRRQHHKLIVMKKEGKAWRVSVETGNDQMGCYVSAHASRC